MKLVILVVSLLTFNINAYRLNSVAEAGARWINLPIQMEINTRNNNGLSSSEIISTMEDAMDKWNTGTNKEIFELTGTNAMSSSQAMALDGTSQIVFSDNFMADTGFDPHTVVAIGGQYGNGTEMRDAFVVFNDENVTWTLSGASPAATGYSDHLLSIAVHELGHTIGLGHSQYSDAVMYGSRTALIKDNLSQDDIDGALYLTSSSLAGSGSSSTRSSGGGGCGSISNVNSTGSGNTNLAILMLMPLLALISFRVSAKNNA
jgi:hypothetical protein